MTKRYIVHMHVGFAGMDAYDALVIDDNATEEQVQHEAHLMAVDHAESYGYYPPSEDDPEDEDEDGGDGGWDSDKVSHGIEGYAEPYNVEEHDQHRCGGGSFEDDFKHLEHE